MPKSKIVMRLKSLARKSFRHEWRRKSDRLSECANCRIEKRTVLKDGRPSVSYGKKGAVAASKVAPNCISAEGRARGDKIRAAFKSATSAAKRVDEKVGNVVVVVNTVRPLLYASDDVQRVLSLDAAGLAAAVESGKLRAPLAGGRWCLADLEDYVSGLRAERASRGAPIAAPEEEPATVDPSPAPKSLDAAVDIVYGGAAEKNATPHSGESAA